MVSSHQARLRRVAHAEKVRPMPVLPREPIHPQLRPQFFTHGGDVPVPDSRLRIVRHELDDERVEVVPAVWSAGRQDRIRGGTRNEAG